MPDPLGAVIRIFETGDHPIAAKSARHWLGGAFDLLWRLQVLRPAGYRLSIPCFACEEPGHLAPLSWNETDLHFWVHCPSAGTHALDSSAPDMVQLDPDALLNTLADALGTPAARVLQLVRASLWTLGTATISKRPYTVLVARGLHVRETLVAVLDRIRLLGADFSILVLCEERPVFVEHAKLKATFAAFSDVLTVDETGFHANPGAIAMLLGSIAPKSREARTTPRETSRALFRQGQEDDLTAATLSGETQRIFDVWPGDDSKPRRALSSIKKHIADLHRQHRRKNNLGEFRVPKVIVRGTGERNGRARQI